LAESAELKKIKKVYGENFMKLCRSLFPTILETEGKLFEILSKSFAANSRTLYDDIVNAGLESSFKQYIFKQLSKEEPEEEIKDERTPYEILDEAGYDLYECTTEKAIQSFKKYYKRDEELCTFRGGRLKSCFVFFAVRKDVNSIKRDDFNNPTREDKYGTSVMSVQFPKEGVCTVSIKNRYNHKVNNPDATYGNDLDRISPGLRYSFAKLLCERGLELNSSNIEEFEMPGYVVANDGRYYKYNMEIDGVYYCPGNIVIKNGNVQSAVKQGKQMLIDYFILDTEKKTIGVADPNIEDSFVDDLQDIEKIEITMNKEKGNGVRTIKIYQSNRENPVIIEINKNNGIIGYDNKNLTEIGNKFLRHNENITELNVPNVTKVGNGFLYMNEGITDLNMPNVTKVGDNFLSSNEHIVQVNFPRLIEVGNSFLFWSQTTELNMPNVIKVGNDFLMWNRSIVKLDMPNLTEVDDNFLHMNDSITELNVPKLTKVGDDFLFWNKSITKLNMPNLMQAGRNFLKNNKSLEKLKTIMKMKKLKSNTMSNKAKISHSDIAHIDKEAKLTTSEVSAVGRFLTKIRENVKKLFMER